MKRIMMTLSMAGALALGAPTQHAQADSSTLGTVIGAVGGGLLGSTIGKGRGKVVATAAGTVIGAVIGHELGSEQDRERPRRVVYHERPDPRPTVIYKERPAKKKKWKRVARYGDDVLVCNRNGKRCHWYD